MNNPRTNETNKLPNIVIIVLDSVRQDHLSVYGYPRQTTPNIDRLAAEGALFENAYSASCWTIPSHASLFTGLYPSQHGVDLDCGDFAPGQETLASYLKTAGYRTACISCNSFVAGKGSGLARGFDLAVDVDGGYVEGSGTPARAARFAQKRWRMLTWRDRGAERATRLAKEWTAQQQGPFFLFMNYMDCHLPYRLKRPQRYHFIPPVERRRVGRIPLDPFAVMAGALELTAREVAGIRALYDGCLYYLDQQVGRLVDHLRALGILDETIFLVTSDHGESFGEHDLFDHQYGLYEHLLRVPLVARFPHKSLCGERIAGPIQLVDLFPALARVIGGASPLDPAGYAVFKAPARGMVLAEYLVPNLNAIRRRFPAASVERFASPLRSISAGGYKLICAQDGRRELYRLAGDPHELTNLAETEREKAAQLEEILFAELGPWTACRQSGGGLLVEDELKERLEAMGYL